MDFREATIKDCNANRWLAHYSLFKHRHPNLTPPFHKEIIDLSYSDNKKVIVMAFRGGSKSTIAEESIIIGALFEEFKNCIIVGSSEKRAVERLRAIKHELISNPHIEGLFGSVQGATWNEERIELSNGVVLQAIGRGQSLRGVKHLDRRPDYCLVDDFEDEETVSTEWARDKTMIWFNNVLMPAMDMTNFRIRVIGTPLHPESVLMKLSREPDWITKIYPVEYIDEMGAKASTWPDRFPLEKIAEIRDSSQRLGQLTQFMQEYMCQAENPESKPFKVEMIRVEGVVRTWHAVYGMIDPARTVNQKSSHTGSVVWSWINNRLVVWEAWGKFLMPDEIIQEMFRINEQYRPVILGIEKDGLEEFLMQPLRQEMVKRGISLPISGEKAPRDKSKLDFIRGLQPFFTAREVIFAKHLPDLESQLLNFPTGRMDVPNALAYALRMRPGRPVYEDFSHVNIMESLKPYGDSPLWLILHGDRSSLTGVLAQYGNSSLRILWDKVMEGEPAERAKDMIEAGQMLYPGIKLIVPPLHSDQWRNIGLKQAIQRMNREVAKGGEYDRGRETIRKLLKESVQGFPAMRISTDARWTLNALAGGYARKINPDMSLSLDPQDGPYRLIMESVESLMANVSSIDRQQDDSNVNYSYTKDGRRYRSALPGNVH